MNDYSGTVRADDAAEFARKERIRRAKVAPQAVPPRADAPPLDAQGAAGGAVFGGAMPVMSGTPEAAANREKRAEERIRSARLETALRNQKMRALESGSLGRDYGGDNSLRIAAIRSASNQLANVEGANAPVQPEMGGSQIQAARAQLQDQLQKLALQRAVEAERMRGTNDAGAEAGAMDAARMNRAATDHFSPLSETDLLSRVGGHEEARKRQIANKAAFARLASIDEGKRDVARGRAAELDNLAFDAEKARIRGETAPYVIAAGQADDYADPEIRAQMRAAKLAQATAQSAQARGEAASQTVAGNAAVREAALADPGWTRSLQSMQQTLGRFGSGYLGENREGVVNQFAKDWDFVKSYISSAPPEQQNVLKQEAMRVLEQAGLSDHPGVADQVAEFLDPYRAMIGFPFSLPTVAMTGDSARRRDITNRQRMKVAEARKYLTQ